MNKLILVIVIFSAFPLCLFSQSLVIDGKVIDRSQKIKMDGTSKLLIHGVSDDSVYIELFHARGYRLIGQKGFLTIDAFNRFDLWLWLKSEYIDLSKSMDKTGESAAKSAAKKGDRIVIILHRNKRHANSWEVFID